jgi:hypothetical protein
MIKFRVTDSGQWEKCEGDASELKLVFSHNIDIGKCQRPQPGTYLGDPQRPERTEKVSAEMERQADKRYAEIKNRLTGVYVPAV